ncbi:hypothetical protein TSOC_010552 [Tetrabaena socialis]|uniref:CRAL/TRIO N-terminal domain-containing protein n=1 Tax=Tetrabaena socialis TaxID=47790 RepID=A0A2J7ZSZ7_9CHLO|nr:hypothetical protein TSOC_010552 [Tetrabaena socialis]|eukprot:PNH03389.1 hypothetical protein TSOC_010552 [Tetrabaena socialis]
MTTESAKLAELFKLCGGTETEQKLVVGGECLDEATLARWLRKRDGDVKAAAKDLKEHAVWRAAFVPRGRIYEEEVMEDLSQNKAFMPGYDKTGRPLCVVVVRRHHIKDAEVSKRCIAYALDCAGLMGARGPAGAAWDGKMSGIFDLRGRVLPPEIQAGGTGSWVRVDERYSLLLANVEAERAAQAVPGAQAAAKALVAPEGQAAAKAAAGGTPADGPQAEQAAQLAAEQAAQRPIVVVASGEAACRACPGERVAARRSQAGEDRTQPAHVQPRTGARWAESWD